MSKININIKTCGECPLFDAENRECRSAATRTVPSAHTSAIKLSAAATSGC